MNRQIYAKKIREEEQAIGETYKQYIETFQNQTVFNKTFIKADTLYAQEGGKENIKYGELYTTKILPKNTDNPPPPPPPPPSSIKRATIKNKSNLKILGDELKQLQNERKNREGVQIPNIVTLKSDNDYNDSTNLFVSNLNTNIKEMDLIKIFGVYGPLASVKIMWPRERESSSSSTTTPNCGFVAFMSRKDAERALINLRNRCDMRINWGRAVNLPSHPIYIPLELKKYLAPPPRNGLPFNAQNFNGNLNDTMVKVTIPFNRNILMLIHRMIEFVIREGPQFEMIIINREQKNPDYNFLYDFNAPEHIYYRWKLYSLLNGENRDNWSLNPFKMYKMGSIWLPPTIPNFRDGMPKELIRKTRQNLTKLQYKKLIKLIKMLNISRKSICTAMVYCLKHNEAIDDIIEIIIDSLKNPKSEPLKKLARLYLLFDILHNCKQKKISVNFFDDDNDCLNIIKELHLTYKLIKHPYDKEQFKIKVLMILKCWLIRKYYLPSVITKFENILLYGREKKYLFI